MHKAPPLRKSRDAFLLLFNLTGLAPWGFQINEKMDSHRRRQMQMPDATLRSMINFHTRADSAHNPSVT